MMAQADMEIENNRAAGKLTALEARRLSDAVVSHFDTLDARKEAISKAPASRKEWEEKSAKAQQEAQAKYAQQKAEAEAKQAVINNAVVDELKKRVPTLGSDYGTYHFPEYEERSLREGSKTKVTLSIEVLAELLGIEVPA